MKRDSLYEKQMQQARAWIKEAEVILVGAGAGVSTAAGLTYSGERFTDHFAEFIEKYGSGYMPDMYAAGFYPFPTQEEKWGYWSKHSMINRFLPPAMPLYQKLYDMVKERDYFVLTTNVDHQFQKAGFEEERIFATQGNYGNIQCEKGCHPKVYEAEELFRQMDRERTECRIPSYLVPKCPVCGGNMTMNLRSDQYFVENETWHEAAGRYEAFLRKYPFWQMTAENPNTVYVCINKGEAFAPREIEGRSICINGDIGGALELLPG